MKARFIPGMELSRRFYFQAVQPILDSAYLGLVHSAARLGSGSEVLGFDTERSADHEWGPRLQIFISEEDRSRHGRSIMSTLSHELPKEFLGYPTHFAAAAEGGAIAVMTATEGPVNHRVEVSSIAGWFDQALGFDPQAGITTYDWLATPTQRFAENTAGAVFHDGLGELETARSKLAWYPDDVWRYALASQWHRISQEEAFIGRTREVGDDLGCTTVVGRLVRDLMRLCFLIERRWAPYNKWLGSAFSQLEVAADVESALTRALSSPTSTGKEMALGRCYEMVANLQNQLGLIDPVDPATRSYHDRPFTVLRAERFAAALQRSITDTDLREAPLVGTIDQVVDSTDVLSHAQRCRAIYETLFRAM